MWWLFTLKTSPLIFRMKRSMRRCVGKQVKILRVIVTFVRVDMMDNLMSIKKATETFFGNQDGPFNISPDVGSGMMRLPDIPIISHLNFATFPAWIACTTKIFRKFFASGIRSANFFVPSFNRLANFLFSSSSWGAAHSASAFESSFVHSGVCISACRRTIDFPVAFVRFVARFADIFIDTWHVKPPCGLSSYHRVLVNANKRGRE